MRLSAMRMSIERMSSIASSGSVVADELSQRLGKRFRLLARARDDEDVAGVAVTRNGR